MLIESNVGVTPNCWVQKKIRSNLWALLIIGLLHQHGACGCERFVQSWWDRVPGNFCRSNWGGICRTLWDIVFTSAPLGAFFMLVQVLRGFFPFCEFVLARGEFLQRGRETSPI